MSEVVEKIDLFSFYNEFFNTKSEIYPLLSESAKTKHFFALRRAISKHNSLFAQLLNRIDSPKGFHIDSLRIMIADTKTNKQPSWMYAKKGEKKVTDYIVELEKISKETINMFKKEEKLSDGCFSEFLRIYPNELLEELKHLDEMNNQEIKKYKK